MHAENSDAVAALEALSRLFSAGVLLLGAEDEIRFANDAACELLDCSGADELRSRWPQLRTRFGGTNRDVALDSGRVVRLGSAPIQPPGVGRLVVLRDKSALEAFDEELTLASRMRSFAYEQRMLSHDLRAPLNAIHLSLELLSTALSEEPCAEQPPKWERHVAVMRSELARVQRWLETTLDQREPAGRPEPVDLGALLEEVARLVGAQARKQQVRIVLDLPAAPARYSASRPALRQALLNMVLDSLEAMKRGGSLRLWLKEERTEAVLTLEDTRAFLEERTIAEMTRLALSRRRSDTGLYVAHRILERQGASVRLERSGSGGARFVTVFPRGMGIAD